MVKAEEVGSSSFQQIDPTLMRRVDHEWVDGFTREWLEIYAGEDGAGGAPHHYVIFVKDGNGGYTQKYFDIDLQHGHPGEIGVNGVGNQTLILVALDFLTKCQAGPFPSPETAEMITHLEEVMKLVRKREDDRKARGVYQRHEK